MVDLNDLGPNAPVVVDAVATLRLPHPRPVHPAIVSARASIDATLRGTLLLPDDALPRPWPWRGRDDRADRRYGLYRLHEILEEATVAATRAVTLLGVRPAAAGQILSQATQARWDLHGLLLPLADGDLDRPPGGVEWTLRQTCGHIALTQSRYTLNTAFWAFASPTQGGTPPDAPDTLLTGRDAAAWSAGTLLDIRARLDTMLDLAVGLLGDVDDASRMEALGVWVGYAVSVRFRLHRFAAHLREHTIQVEKTLAMLGRQPREVERIVRLILGAYGRLEAVVLCLPNGTLAGEFGQGRSLAGLLAETANEVAVVAGSIDT